MARKLEVEILATTLGYTRSLTKAAEQTKTFARTVDDSSKHIGRSLAFATGGFVAFAGAADFLKASIDAARTTEVAQKSLAAQLKASGESWTTSKTKIDQAGLSLAKFGFTAEDSLQALTVLDRATGNVTKSIGIQGIAANIARARNISLSAAALILGKAYDGQTTSLKRLGVELPKGVKGMDAIWIAGQKFAGQAKANTTVAERFSATLHDTEVIVGTALLPTLDKLLTSLGNWLTKMNESGKLQRDVNSAVKTGTALFQALVPWVDAAKSAFKYLGDAVGGTKNEVELLVGAFVAFKSAKVATSIASAISGVRQIGTTAEASTGEVAGLRGALAGLAGPAAIVAGLLVAGKELGGLYNGSSAQAFTDKLFGNTEPLDVAGLHAQAKEGGIMGSIARKVLAEMGPAGKLTLYGPPAPASPPVVGRVNVPGGLAGSYPTGAYTPEQKLQIALAASPNNIGLLRQQAGHDRAAIAFLQKLHAAGKGPAPKTLAAELEGFYSDLNSQLSTIAGIQSAAASKTAAARKKAAAAAKKAAAEAKQDAVEARKMIARLIGRQHESPEQYVARAERPGAFERLGPLHLASYNVPASLQLTLAREQATGSSQTATLQAARAAARKALRSGRLSLQAQIEAWNEISSLNQQLASSAKGASDTFRQQRNRAVTLAHAQGADYQFAYARGGPVIHIEHFHSSASNPAALENELVKRARARPHVRRGAR